MDLWSSPDPNLHQQCYDPFVNDLFALRDGFGSSGRYPPSASSSHFFPPTVGAPRKRGQRRNTIINTPDGTQRRPITRVPAEVWADILRRCIPSREENDRIPTLSPSKAPMQLTAITKGLRHIALAMPELWTSISLVPNRDHELPCPETLEYWLRLSQNLPLTISVARNRYRGAGDDLEYLFWKLAKWSSKRWEHLYANPIGIDGADGRWRRYVFPRLKSVTIQGGIQPPSLPECFKSLIKTSESLKALSWTDVEPLQFERRSEFLLNVSFPLSRLQHLKLSNPLWPSDALHMLKDAPMLQTLEFTALKGIRYTSVIMGTYPTQPIQLLHLRSLSVNALKFEEERGQAVRTSMDDFLPYIFTPNLHSLSIGYNDDQRGPFTALQSFFTTTRCRLTSLTFSYTPPVLERTSLDSGTSHVNGVSQGSSYQGGSPSRKPSLEPTHLLDASFPAMSRPHPPAFLLQRLSAQRLFAWSRHEYAQATVQGSASVLALGSLRGPPPGRIPRLHSQRNNLYPRIRPEV